MNDIDAEVVAAACCGAMDMKTDCLCYDCKLVLCKSCLERDHVGHKTDNVEIIRESLSNKETKVFERMDLWCMPRLNHLWRTLKQCVTSHQSLQHTHSDLTQHFEHLIKVIITQEHKIKTPITDQLSRVQTTIKDILNEIRDINQIVNMEGASVDGGRGDDPYDDMSELIESIASCDSIEQFINSTHKIDDQSSEKEGLSDNELLNMIAAHIKHMRLVRYGAASRPQEYRVDTDVAKLDGIRKQIESCFKLITTSSRRSDGEDAQTKSNILSIKGRECSMYSLATTKWQSIGNVFDRTFSGVYTSVVHARGHVYVFGGLDAPTTYSRYSLADQLCQHTTIADVSGGQSISACYDGDRLIYLVGGSINNRYLDRVDVFDIDTQRFRHVGQLPYGLTFPQTYFYNDTIIVVCGAITGILEHTDILSFNIYTKTTAVLFKDVHRTNFVTSCFDDDDNIYVLSKTSFMRYTLSTKQVSKLMMGPTYCYLCRIEYDDLFGIVYVGGGGNNYRYSLQDDKWTRINDNDHIQDRSWYGG
ncbi:hypothetical protein SAMD00019534_062260, partial [Acytostelium subglobosum LB1]|uniref:hypothetical protein n=1 Tax=Acytostelium subglobosum LB1 TaxID=1410327 RepID=UPI000644882A